MLVWEPPTRLVFTWQINGSWQFDPDPERASEIECLDGQQAIRDAINGGGGWALLLEGFAKTVAEQG